MAEIGIVVGVRIGAGYRHGKTVVILDCVIDDPADVQGIEYMFPSGVQSVPQEGESVLIHDVSSEYRVATSTNHGIIVVSDGGESAIFAVDGDTVKSSLKTLKNGDLVLNDGTGFAVEFVALKSAWDLLITWVSAISTAAVVPIPIPTPSLDGCKVENVRV